jgi:hypothetical protein
MISTVKMMVTAGMTDLAARSADLSWLGIAVIETVLHAKT